LRDMEQSLSFCRNSTIAPRPSPLLSLFPCNFAFYWFLHKRLNIFVASSADWLLVAAINTVPSFFDIYFSVSFSAIERITSPPGPTQRQSYQLEF
jgi:hypothetical protein